MKRFSEQFHTKSKSVTLSSAEKQELRERLVSYMEYHPLPAELKAAKKTTATKSPFFTEAFKTVSVPLSLIFKSSAVAAAFVMVVVPFMAEQSVPGDTLYAVKVQFNEEIRGTLTFDSYQKVEWETQRVNRRIAEARLLESEGRLTEEAKAEVAKAVRTHTQSAQKEIQNLREFDAEEATIASIEFGSNLEAQSASLKADELENNSDTLAVASRVRTVNLIADAIDESRILNEQPDASTTPSYAKLIARVEQNTTRMYELSNALESLNPHTKEDVARLIQDIDRSVVKAIEELDDNELEARDILIDVLKRTQKMIVFMTDPEVSDTIDIEKLIPVVLTNDEKVAKITAYKEELTVKQTQIEAAVAKAGVIQNPSTAQKVTDQSIKITALRAQSEEASRFEDVQRYAQEAIDLADDLLNVLERNSVENASSTDTVATPPVRSSSTASSTPLIPLEKLLGTGSASASQRNTPSSSVDAR